MITADVIIVGGGPAGSTCAWKLGQNGIKCIILDRAGFPRDKLCAGWITPQVLVDLDIDAGRYPHTLIKFDRFMVHLGTRTLSINVNQYAIRRIQFDHWLLQRCNAEVHTHPVNAIIKDGKDYVVDDCYRCRYIIGAGGTFCPVYRNIFSSINPRNKGALIVTLEQELDYDHHDHDCHLWFFQKGLPGYSWYVPKGPGIVNVGIGGSAGKLKASYDNIRSHWRRFNSELQRSLIKNRQFKGKGYVYYIRDSVDTVQIDNAFLAGDAAGLATRDMGEGIGPAVQSGILAAQSIITGSPYSLKKVKKRSFPRLKTALILSKARLRSKP